jgi:hypothetical protein
MMLLIRLLWKWSDGKALQFVKMMMEKHLFVFQCITNYDWWHVGTVFQFVMFKLQFVKRHRIIAWCFLSGCYESGQLKRHCNLWKWGWKIIEIYLSFKFMKMKMKIKNNWNLFIFKCISRSIVEVQPITFSNYRSHMSLKPLNTRNFV